MSLAKCKRLVRDALDVILRFVYKKTVGKDFRSNIRIQKFGEFYIAFRKETADEQVISGSYKERRFFNMVPEYVSKQKHVIIDV